MKNSSGIGVLDKTMVILHTISEVPCQIVELSHRTGLPRATTHRLVKALEYHRLLYRDVNGVWHPGPALHELSAKPIDSLLDASSSILPQLRDVTGESVQLYRIESGKRVCIATSEPRTGLRDTVPIGAHLPLTVGASSKVLLAWNDSSLRQSALREGHFTEGVFRDTKRRGWAKSNGEREPGVASVAVPVYDAQGTVIAALSVSGPSERFDKRPAHIWAAELKKASAALTRELSR